MSALQQHRVVLPHAGDDADDFRRLVRVEQQRHETHSARQVGFDQQTTLSDFHSGTPLARQRYRISTQSGCVITGTCDDQGVTERFTLKDPYEPYTVELIRD